jgi:hypothetical protein
MSEREEENGVDHADNFLSPQNEVFYNSGVYRDLDHDRKEIRLLAIMPGEDSDELRCELLQNVPLVHRPIEKMHKIVENARPEEPYPPGFLYIALSYSAGDPYDTERIWVKGVYFNVFRSLANAIRRLRTGKIMIVWADQVCINQKSVEERNQQVALMGEIYCASYTCAVWLGDDERGEADAVIDCLKVFATMEEAGHDDETVLQKVLDSQDFDNDMAKLKRFFEKSWWSRCWVLQEAILAPATMFLYGNSEGFSKYIGRKQVVAAHDLVAKQYQLLIGRLREIHGASLRGPVQSKENYILMRRAMATQEVKGLSGFFGLLKAVQPAGRIPLQRALNWSRKAKSTDARDRVYAVLGMVEQRYQMMPDYSRNNSACEVFMQVVQTIVQNDGWLDILTDCVGENSSDLCLPSWIPDFTNEILPLYFVHLGTHCLSRPECPMTRSACLFGKVAKPLNVTSNHFQVRFPTVQNSSASCVLEVAARFCGNVAFQSTLGIVGKDTEKVGFFDANINKSEKEEDEMLRDWRRCISSANIREIYRPTKEAPEVALNVCLGWGALADVGNARTHWRCLPVGVRQGLASRMHSMNHRNTIVGNKWRFFVTPDGFMGVGPAKARHDDLLAVLFDVNVPFVIRKLSEKSSSDYKLLGPAYVHGFDVGRILEQACESGHKSDVHRICLH